MTNHYEIQDRLSDYVDATLPRLEHAEVAAHLQRCEECRLEAEAFRLLAAEAAELPTEISPPRDLWPEIAARIQERGGAGTVAAPKVIDIGTRVHRGWRPLGLAAAAAVALVVLSSAITARMMQSRAAAPVATAEQTQRAARPTTALAAFGPAEAQYLSSAEELTAELEARRHLLAPETVATIEENLRIIDGAILEARAALEQDPSSAELPGLLSDVYRQKVELLQKAVQLPART